MLETIFHLLSGIFHSKDAYSAPSLEEITWSSILTGQGMGPLEDEESTGTTITYDDWE